MKTIKRTMAFLLVLTAGVYSSCKKDEVMYNKGIESFVLVAKDAQGAKTEYPGIIVNEEIVVDLPIEVDVTAMTSKYIVDNARTIVQVGTEVIEPEVTVLDLTNPVNVTVKAEDKSKRTYKVRVEKKIALESFGFYAEDNAGLIEEDYKAVIRGNKIEIAVHETVDLTKLVARFQTTSGATMKIGDAVQQSQATENNFSNTVVYTFEAPGLPAPVDFNTAVSFIGPKWWMIGDESIIKTSAGDLKMAINPITKYPYLVYYRTGKEGTETISSSGRRAVVIAYTGTGWSYIGSSQGISDTTTADTHIAFDEEGTPYVSYKDYLNGGQKATVLKYTDNQWEAVGDKNFSPMRTDKFSFTIGENNQPLLAISTGTAITGYARRAIYVTNFRDGQWNNITPAIVNPLIGAVKVIKGLDGKTYMAVLDRNSNFSMYRFQNNTWIPVGPVGFRTSDGLPGYTSVTGAVDAEGTVYIAFQNLSAGKRLNRVMKFNGTDWVELGSAGNSQGKDELYSLAVAPDGKLYFAFANDSGLYFRTFNENTNNWNTERQVVSGNIFSFDMQVSQDGIPYIAVSSPNAQKDNKTTVYKYTNTK